jgi:hypothetical protein
VGALVRPLVHGVNVTVCLCTCTHVHVRVCARSPALPLETLQKFKAQSQAREGRLNACVAVWAASACFDGSLQRSGPTGGEWSSMAGFSLPLGEKEVFPWKNLSLRPTSASPKSFPPGPPKMSGSLSARKCLLGKRN